MKRLPALLVALLLITSCRENPTMPDNRPASQEHPQTASDTVPTNEELLTYAEEHLAAYRYHDAAAWAYKLKRQGIALSPRLQQVLDEERYNPDTPVSTRQHLPSPAAANQPASGESEKRRHGCRQAALAILQSLCGTNAQE